MPVWNNERILKARASLSRWHGTPHHNRISVPGIGIDCIKLVHEVGFDAGIWPRCELGAYDVADGMYAESTRLQEAILSCVNGVWIEYDPEPFEFGDIVIFTTGRRSAHCGFVDPPYVWHALAHRCVTKSDLVLWRKEISGGIRLFATGFAQSPDKVKF